VDAVEHRYPPGALLLDQPPDQIKAQAVQPDQGREGQEEGKGLGLQGRAKGKARDDEGLAEGGQERDKAGKGSADAQDKAPDPGRGLRASGEASGELGGEGLGGVEEAQHRLGHGVGGQGRCRVFHAGEDAILNLRP
jgi:hypothetical protein